MYLNRLIVRESVADPATPEYVHTPHSFVGALGLVLARGTYANGREYITVRPLTMHGQPMACIDPRCPGKCACCSQTWRATDTQPLTADEIAAYKEDGLIA